MFFDRNPFRPSGDSTRPCVIARRMIRDDENLWQTARSCLGGEPTLGIQQWPVSNGYPMHCIAQIDLAEVARAGRPFKGLPTSGLLAFFLDSETMTAGAVRLAPDTLPIKAQPPRDRPRLYGQHWGSMCKGACDMTDAPTSFPRWPLTFTAAKQKETGNERYEPALDDIFGPQARSVHLDTSGIVAGEWKGKDFHPEEDAAPFPARAATLILKDAIYTVTRLMGDGYLGVYKPAPDADVKPYVDVVHDRARAAAEATPILQRWEEMLRDLDPNQPLGAELGERFTADLRMIKEILHPRRGYLRFGRGTTTTTSAALRAYFDMYMGTRASFEAIPPVVRTQIGRERLRSAYSGNLIHQMGGYGAQIQDTEMEAEGMILLFQIATDEAVNYMWGDAGVAQYWIAADDLAAGAWEKVRFVVTGG